MTRKVTKIKMAKHTVTGLKLPELNLTEHELDVCSEFFNIVLDRIIGAIPEDAEQCYDDVEDYAMFTGDAQMLREAVAAVVIRYGESMAEAIPSLGKLRIRWR
jgi:hypothetical protein